MLVQDQCRRRLDVATRFATTGLYAHKPSGELHKQAADVLQQKSACQDAIVPADRRRDMASAFIVLLCVCACPMHSHSTSPCEAQAAANCHPTT